MHQIYKNSNGNEIPSVTTVMKIFYKDGLLEWSNAIGKKGIDYTSFLNSRATVGTRIHTAVEAILNGEDLVKPLIATVYDNEVDLAVGKFKTSGYNLKFKNVKTEISYKSERYGGTIDLIGDLVMSDGSFVKILGDFKTSKSIYKSQFIQLGAYLNLIKENDIDTYNKIEYCAIISINKDNCKLQYISKDDCEKYFTKFFMILLDAYELWHIGIKNLKLISY